MGKPPEKQSVPDPRSDIVKEADTIGMLFVLSVVYKTWQSKHNHVRRRGHNVAAALIDHKTQRVIGVGVNRNFEKNSPLEHAEIRALKKAVRHNHQIQYTKMFDNVTLYSTLEPCPMCAGSFIMANIPRVIYGQKDPKYRNLITQLYQTFRKSYPAPRQWDHPLTKQLDRMYKNSATPGPSWFLEKSDVRDEIFKRSETALMRFTPRYQQNKKLLDHVRQFYLNQIP